MVAQHCADDSKHYSGWQLVSLVRPGTAAEGIAAAIPLVVSSFVVAGNVAYIWRCPPRTKHASDRQLIDKF